MTEFDFNEYTKLYENGMLKDHLDAKNYISKFFYPLTTGQHALIENNEISLISDDIMKKVYIARWDNDIIKWYKKNTIPRKLICDLDKPMIGDKFINVSKQLKHQYVKYSTFDNKIKTSVEMILKYIDDVWANNNKDMFNYIISWLSDMVKGKKNQSCLYAKSIEGVGKSTLTEFISEYVIGNDVYLKGKSDHLKGEHNLGMLGKLLVVFEELQIFSEKEWHAIDAELKDLITCEKASYTDKYEKRFDAKNTNNYIILTNFDLKGAHGRRVVVLEISTKYLNDFEYFKKLRKECFNNTIGHAFFCYLMDHDTSKYESYKIPETSKKRELYLHLLPAQEKFLKKYFLLRQIGINMKCKDLFEMFRESEEFKQGMTPHNFYSHLLEIGFKKKVGHARIEKYEISYGELLEFAKKRKWVDSLDHETIEDNENNTQEQSDLTIEQQIHSLENQKYGIEQQIIKLKQQLEKPIIKIVKSSNIEIEYNKLKSIHEKYMSSQRVIEYVDEIVFSKSDFDLPEHIIADKIVSNLNVLFANNK